MLNITPLHSPTHEQVVQFNDDKTGLQAIIAIHSTKRGPALGGTRFWSYATEQDMLNDVLALSEAMTYKNAAAELPCGGGKAVINLPPGVKKTSELLKAYGEAVNYFNGTFITAEDVGCQPGDMTIISSVTPYCPKNEKPSGPATALGVLSAMIAGIKLGIYELRDATVVVQGVGNVGSMLCEMLVHAGAEVIVTDTDAWKVNALIKRFPSIKALQSSSYLQPEPLAGKIKIFAPCALGPALRVGDAALMASHYDIVCGAANNAVEKAANQELEAAGITYCPDFIANAGGVISVHHDIIGTAHPMIVAADIIRIGSRMFDILDGMMNQITAMDSAIAYAKERLK